VEGSLVRGVETAVQYCPLDQLTGVGNIKWTLTSGDMLSFARQIALAMVSLYFTIIILLPIAMACLYVNFLNMFHPIQRNVTKIIFLKQSCIN